MLTVFRVLSDAKTVSYILGTQIPPMLLGLDLHNQFRFENLGIQSPEKEKLSQKHPSDLTQYVLFHDKKSKKKSRRDGWYYQHRWDLNLQT